MTACGRVVIVAERDHEHTVLRRLSSSGMSAARATLEGVLLVAAGASPVGGDELVTEITVGAGAQLWVGSIGATLARRGSVATAVSHSRVEVVIEAGGALGFEPEPGIAGSGCRHRSSISVEMSERSCLVLRDEIVLGRVGEEPGTWWSYRSIAVDQRPIVVSEIGLGPQAESWPLTSVTGGARAMSSLVLVGEAIGDVDVADRCGDGRPSVNGGVLALAGTGIEVLALGSSLAPCRAFVDDESEVYLEDLFRSGAPVAVPSRHLGRHARVLGRGAVHGR